MRRFVVHPLHPRNGLDADRERKGLYYIHRKKTRRNRIGGILRDSWHQERGVPGMILSGNVREGRRGGGGFSRYPRRVLFSPFDPALCHDAHGGVGLVEQAPSPGVAPTGCRVHMR